MNRAETSIAKEAGVDLTAKRLIIQILSSDWTLEEKTLVPELRKPFDVLAEGLVGAGVGGGEGKVTPLELFAVGVIELEVDVRDLIRATAWPSSSESLVPLLLVGHTGIP